MNESTVAERNEADRKLRRLEELNDYLAERNGRAVGLDNVVDILRLFRLADRISRYPSAILRYGRVLAVNQEFQERFGWDEANVIGRDAAELVPARERERVMREIEKPAPWHYDTVVLTGDGEEVPVHVHADHIGPFRFSTLRPREDGQL